ncbi:serine carboxypeptidase S28 family protein (macronuclear) [Tetrahymena thermophila SB210]|uniref:Serine carboxypeptidase S28 family protein n=1 Tax=Tetrahymena thermophila (strain SB210) TaxID=312017 RepID=Q23AY4_TETTS|nr:serine carboxypeptidase S28 family protein [Tetrahymena thermophila SB210]EAR93700.2 serine carboxypeptidase S28 family protein [Tetrahymena thermophila SB210]|eukprot:XP_001013945.2 serine carboxypeptidase S28 family protein [Tetrahymena thermophila SB210]
MREKLILILLALISFSACQPINQTQLWFDYQLTDHFNITNNRTWSQRYWVLDQYYNPQNGSVLLYICGEYTCPGIPEERQFPILLAQKFSSLVLVLEHRFYGNSMPFGDQSMKQHNLYLLNVDQALADLAYFITYVKDHHLHGVQNHIPWLTIGGSYPGAMSAWFRYKYPHLTVGALASSAVVNAILDYYQMDQQVILSALRSGEKCAQSIHDLNIYVQNLLQNPTSAYEIKKQFNAEHLNNGEFLYFYTDIFTGMVQYGSRTVLCNQTLNYPTIEQQYQSILNYTKENNVTVNYYGSYYLRNDTYDPENDGSRQWTWQYCTEFGFFQTCSNPQTGSRSTEVNLDMFTNFCKQSFTQDIFPNPSRVNIQYGGVNLKATNLILTNGIEDPWRWAGLQQSSGDIVSYLIDCDDCAHCVDLYTPKETDALVLKQTREKIVEHFSQWIKEHYDSLEKSNQNLNITKTNFVKSQLLRL